MPKQRPPFDADRYQALKAQGLSQRLIAQDMGIPESTLRDNLRVLQKAQASQGLPQADQGPPEEDQGGPLPPISLGPPQPDQAETAALAGHDAPTPPQGGPVDTEGGPMQGTPQVHLGPPTGVLSPQLSEDLTAAWSDLAHMLEWWRQRQQSAQEPTEKLERVTYHVSPTWIEAVRREADLTGESYAAVVNRAFAAYFGAKST